MGRIGNTPANGCAPLGEHLLGAVLQFGDGAELGDAPGLAMLIPAADGAVLSDAPGLAMLIPAADGAVLSDAPGLAMLIPAADGVELGEALIPVIPAADGIRPHDRIPLGQFIMGGLLGAWNIAIKIGIAPDGAIMSDSYVTTMLAKLADGSVLSDYAGVGLYLADGAELSDGLTGVGLYPADGAELSDAPGLTILVPLTDGAELSDAQIATMLIPLSDGAVLSDAPGLAMLVPLTDGAVLSDAQAPTFTLSDGAELSDRVSLIIGISDGAELSDSASSGLIPGLLLELQGQADDQATEITLNLVEGDTLPLLVFLLLNRDGDQYDLDAATVTFRMRLRDADPGDYKINAACTYLSSGLLQYTLTAANTNTPGEYYADLLMDFGGGVIFSSEIFQIRIRERL